VSATEQQRYHFWKHRALAFDVVALAASAGGLKALSCVLAGLPADFPAAVLVVQHLHPHQPSLLADMLRRRTALRVEQAKEGEVVRPATAFTPVPDRHLLVNPGGSLSLSQGPRVQFARPSADVLFESVASAYGERAVAVVLTGRGRDGAQGVQAVRGRGGFVIAQDEATSEHFDMPSAAIATGNVDLILPLHAIGRVLRALQGAPGA
jgi:two-component system chemotaxis response regulator CheB